MRQVIFFLLLPFLFFYCKSKQTKSNLKYYMVTVTEDFSILSNFKKERETKVDSFFTDSDQNAFDSANMHFESLRFANAVVHNTAKKVGVTKKELQYYNSKPISVNVFNAAGVDIFPNISASVKKEIEERNKKMFDAMLNQ